MEYLCFVNGRNQNELVKIIEGELYEIDRLTTSCIDSDAIRKKYKKQFSEFQTAYPDAKRGAVRIFGDNVYGDNGKRVLYKKHKVAFNEIIKDKQFLRWSSREDLNGKRGNRLIYDTYILKGITEYHLELTRINQFLATIKRDDRNDIGLTGGGKRYYRFVRGLLSRYEEYYKEFNKPSIDDIWKEYLSGLEKIKLEKESLGEQIIISPEIDEEELFIERNYEVSQEPQYDPDLYPEEPVFEEPIYEFFTGDYFERLYGETFAEDDLMMVGDLSLSKDLNKLKPFQEVVDNCYNGKITNANLSSFSRADLETFTNAKIVIVYGEEDNRRLQVILANAIQNQASVVFISDDTSLIAKYAKKFKQIIPILDQEDDKHLSSKKQLVTFFVDQYQNNKGYSKK